MRIMLKDGTVIEQEAKLEIDTALGTLLVEPVDISPKGSFPGVYISLKRPNNNLFTPILVEVDQFDLTDVQMKAHYWSPESHWDEPVWDVSLTPEHIDSAFREGE